jgi:hypothetical protein
VGVGGWVELFGISEQLLLRVRITFFLRELLLGKLGKLGTTFILRGGV